MSRCLGLREKAKEAEKELKAREKSVDKWNEEGWELLDPKKQKLERVVEKRDAEASWKVFGPSGLRTRLAVFLWMYPMVEKVADDQRKYTYTRNQYLFATAIRIYINAINSTAAERKPALQQFWNERTGNFVRKFRPLTHKLGLAYQYRKWSKVFTTCAAEIDDWFLYSERWCAAVSRPEYLASDEKNYKTRCKSNPLVSMVKEKSNAVVGIWFFQMACYVGGKAYLIATRPAKALKGDKSVEIWAQWVAAFLPEVHELPSSGKVVGLNVCDSLYGSSGSAACFDNNKIPFLIGLRGGVFEHVQKKLKNVAKKEGEFGVAWSHKLGRAVVCAYATGSKKRKFCFTNAYRVVPQTKKVPTGGVVNEERLSTYVTSAIRPAMCNPDYTPAVVRRPSPPAATSRTSPSPTSPLPQTTLDVLNNPHLLPKGSYIVKCPHCPCPSFFIKIKKGEAIASKEPPLPPRRYNTKKRKRVGEGGKDGERGDGKVRRMEEGGGEGEKGEGEEGDGKGKEGEGEGEGDGKGKGKEKEGGAEAQEVGEEEEKGKEREEKKKKEKQKEIKKKLKFYSQHCGLLCDYVPEPYLDYSSSYQACDNYNSYLHHHQWEYRRQGANSEKNVGGEYTMEKPPPKGWELVVDTFYFTCSITNAWVLYTSMHQLSAGETFKTFSLALVDEIIEHLVNQKASG